MCQHFGRKALKARRFHLSIIAYNAGLVPIYRAVSAARQLPGMPAMTPLPACLPPYLPPSLGASTHSTETVIEGSRIIPPLLGRRTS